jgi:biopolymer transport protein ExbB
MLAGRQPMPVSSAASAGSRDIMIEIIKAGGWLMLPIILCSIIAVAITIERLWTLQRGRVLPKDLTMRVWEWARGRQLDQKHLNVLAANSPMGRVLAAGLANRHQSREVLKEIVQDTGRHVVHELERYLNSLGTIAAITPLLGLLGTVIGMVKVFTAITTAGVGNPSVLAGGISEALITTAAGLSVAIPSLIAYRYLRGQVDALVVEMEKEAMKLVDALHGTPAAEVGGA